MKRIKQMRDWTVENKKMEKTTLSKNNKYDSGATEFAGYFS